MLYLVGLSYLLLQAEKLEELSFFLGFFSGLSLTLLNFDGLLKVFIFYNSVKNQIIFVIWQC